MIFMTYRCNARLRTNAYAKGQNKKNPYPLVGSY